LAADQRGGVGGGRREPHDAAGVLPHPGGADVVLRAAETHDQDSEDRRLVEPRDRQRRPPPATDRDTAPPRREVPHRRGAGTTRALSSRTWARTPALRAMNSGVAMISAGRGRASFTVTTSRISPGRAVITATRSARKSASSMS